MSVRNTVLFTPERKAAPGLLALWVQKGGAQPLGATMVLLEEDLSATRLLRGLWQRAFPDRQPLPFGALGTKAGTGTNDLWEALS